MLNTAATARKGWSNPSPSLRTWHDHVQLVILETLQDAVVGGGVFSGVHIIGVAATGAIRFHDLAACARS